MKRFFGMMLFLTLLLCGCGGTTGKVTETEGATESETETVTGTSTETETEKDTETETEAPVVRTDFKIIVKDDAYVYNNDGTSDFSNTNFGKTADLQIKSNKNALTRYAYVKFDISKLVGDDSFTAIELDLMLKSKQSMPGNPEYATVELYSVSPEGWNEKSITFNDRPDYVDLVARRDDIKEVGKVYSFPITSYVKRALENGETEVAFFLADASGVPLHIKFESKDGGKMTPMLSVYYDTKVDETVYLGKMWGRPEPELSQNGIDTIVGLRKAGNYTISVKEDTYIEAGTSAAKNFGSSSIVDFKAMGAKKDNYYRISLLKFDVSDIKAEDYAKIELDLNCISIEKGDITVQVNVYGCDPDSWKEMSVTYNTAPERGKLVTRAFVTRAGQVRIDVTDYVKQCLADGQKQVSLYLEGVSTSLRRLQFSSRESGGGAPKLLCGNGEGEDVFVTYLPYSGVNPWENAMTAVKTWLARWADIKKGGDTNVTEILRDASEYTLTVDAATYNTTKGANTVYKQYSTRTVDSLKGFDALAVGDESKLYDIYGGYMGGEKYEATGYFYTKKIGDRWWTIDPLGYPFFRVACVSVSMGNQTQEKLALAKYGSVQGWAKSVTDRLRELGFNSTGGWSSIAYLSQVEQPLSQTYVMTVLRRYCQNMGFMKTVNGSESFLGVMPVFDPSFTSSADSLIKSTVSPYADAAYVYGWMSDNELPAGLNMLDLSLSLDPSEERFAYTYAVAWTFMCLKLDRTDVTLDDVTDDLRREFRAMAYDRYFEVVCNSLEKYAPNHQYMGCRFLEGCYADEYVMRVAGYHCDVITYNYYHAWQADPVLIANQQRWAGKPFIVTEWYAKGMDVWEKNPAMTNTTGWGWTVRTQNDRGLFYENFALQLLQCRGCVGFDWFKYQDNDPSDPYATGADINSNKGIIDNNGDEYADLVKHMQKVNAIKYALIEHFDK